MNNRLRFVTVGEQVVGNTRPELLILQPSDPEEPSFVSLVERCVERGLYFTFDSHERLPVSIGTDLSSYRAIVLDPRLRWKDREPYATPLKEYIAQGGVVREFSTIDSFRRDLENPYDNFLDLLIDQVGLTPQHPGIRSALASRDDRQLLESLVDSALEPSRHRPHLDQSLHSLYTSLGDTGSYWARRPLMLAGLYFQDPEILEKVVHWVDLTMASRENPPLHLDGVSDACTWIWAFKSTGNEQYLHYIRERVDRVIRTFPRVHGVASHSVWMTTESCAMLAPTLAALGACLDEPEYTDRAIDHLERVYRHHFDRSDGLWHHGTRPGKKPQQSGGEARVGPSMGLLGRSKPYRRITQSGLGCANESKKRLSQWGVSKIQRQGVGTTS